MEEHTWVVLLVGEGPREQLGEWGTVTWVEGSVIAEITGLQEFSLRNGEAERVWKMK